MFLGFFMAAMFVMMRGLAVMMGCRFMMHRGTMMMFGRGMSALGHFVLR